MLEYLSTVPTTMPLYKDISHDAAPGFSEVVDKTNHVIESPLKMGADSVSCTRSNSIVHAGTRCAAWSEQCECSSGSYMMLML
eukprot:4815376-Pyramimonas_sp.AAC.1